MKLRYAIFFIAICFILYWSYLGVINSGDYNNKTEQLETKLYDMNTIDKIPVKEIEDDNDSSVILDKKIIDAPKDAVMITETTKNYNNPNIYNEDIKDGAGNNTTVSIDSAESIDKLFRVLERKDNYNNELQSYNKDNVTFTDNKIIITSKKEDKDGKKYTSGLVESSYAYLNGYFEFTIKMSYGKGIFPAIWLMPADYSSYPEVDIFEMIGSKPKRFYGVVHYMNDKNIKSRNYFGQNVELKDSYKIALQWNTNELIWYIDDKIVYRTANGTPNQYMYIIINQAVGGNWPGSPDVNTVFPSEFTIQGIVIKPIQQQLRYTENE